MPVWWVSDLLVSVAILTASDEKVSILLVYYLYFDPETRMAYTFTIMDSAKHDLKSIALLEQVALSTKITRKG